MTLFILDTDAASLFLAGNKKLIDRVTQEVAHVVTTIVTVIIQFRRVGKLSQKDSVSTVVFAHQL